MQGTGVIALYKCERINFSSTQFPPLTMFTIIQSISASILPRRLRRWVSTRSQSFMPKFRPFGNIGQPACLTQLTTKARTQVIAGLSPQIQERGFNSRIHSALNFHRGISRIPIIQREAVHSPPSPMFNFYSPVEILRNTIPSANSNQPSHEPDNALRLSCYSPQYRFTDVEFNANSRRPIIEPKNPLRLSFDTPPFRILNSESLSTTPPLRFQTSQNEAYTAETPLEPLDLNLSLFRRIRQDLQTTESSANSSRPFVEPNNALGLWFDTPRYPILGVQSPSANSSRHTIEPNNALGLSLGYPQPNVGIEYTYATLPLGFRDDDTYPELPPFEQLNANFDFFREDLQTTEPSAYFRPPTIECSNFPRTESNFNPFWDLPNTDLGSDISHEAASYSNSSNADTLGEQPPKSQELTVTFGGKFGRQVRWEDIMPSVEHFVERCTRDTAHSLTVVLEPSNSIYDQWERRQTLKQLFDLLKLTGPITACTDERHDRNVVFNRISITVPDEAENVNMMLVASPWNNSSGRRISDDSWEKIDITSASNLREFLWNGPFQQLSENFLYPADGLTLLSITSCRISINDAVELLRPCSSLEEVQLETVHDTKVVEPLTLNSGSKFNFSLKKFSVTSSIDLSSMLKLITWAPRDAKLDITFLDNGAQDANALLCSRFIPTTVSLNLKGRFLQRTMNRYKRWDIN